MKHRKKKKHPAFLAPHHGIYEHLQSLSTHKTFLIHATYLSWFHGQGMPSNEAAPSGQCGHRRRQSAIAIAVSTHEVPHTHRLRPSPPQGVARYGHHHRYCNGRCAYSFSQRFHRCCRSPEQLECLRVYPPVAALRCNHFNSQQGLREAASF